MTTRIEPRDERFGRLIESHGLTPHHQLLMEGINRHFPLIEQITERDLEVVGLQLDKLKSRGHFENSPEDWEPVWNRALAAAKRKLREEGSEWSAK